MGGSSDQQQNSQQDNGAVLALLAFMLWAVGGGGPALPQARRQRAASGSGYVGQPWPLPPPAPPMPRPVTLPAAHGDIQAELKANFSQGRTRPAAIVAWNRKQALEAPPEVRGLGNSDEWTAFQSLDDWYARTGGATAVMGAGEQSAGFMPWLTVQELAGVRDAMRSANNELMRLKGLGGDAGSVVGSRSYVHVVDGRVRRSGSAASFGEGGATSSLPRAVGRLDVEESLELMAARLVVV